MQRPHRHIHTVSHVRTLAPITAPGAFRTISRRPSISECRRGPIKTQCVLICEPLRCARRSAHQVSSIAIVAPVNARPVSF